MVAREATSSRRGSMWSSFGEGGASGPANMTEEEKAQEARKAFNRSFRTIWDSGVDKISGDLWDSLVTGWKSGDIIGASPSSLPHFVGSQNLNILSTGYYRPVLY